MRNYIHVDYVLDDLVQVVGGKNKGKMGYVVGVAVNYAGKEKTDTETTYVVDAYIMANDNKTCITKKIRVSENNLTLV